MEIRGSAGKGEALVDFVVTGESGIVLTLPNVYASEPTATVLPDGSGVEIQISKPLRYHGYLTTNSVGNPLAGEITRIVSKGDDPGRGEWQERDARDQLLQRTSLLEGIDPKVFEGLRPKFDPKLFEALRPKFDPKLFEGLRPKFDPKVLEALRPKFEPGVLEALRPKIDPKLFEGLRPKFDPKLFEGLRPKIDPKLFEGLRPKIDPKLFEGLRPKIDPKLFEAPRPTTPAPHEPDETTGPGDRSDSSLPHEDADSSGLSAAAPQASADSEPADAAPKPGSDENSGDGRHEAPADGETRPDET
ncbi:hypothetical protein EV653_4775 [Kribbella pratensis]|uniref:Uncharacterized protein n=2 Tax=Kribbella pratensis TaxID=2512112 RepID=A0A4R8C6A0_9ACTN|nr:hypothetical protein EV653_4775 [Kribbella pratensis]